MKNKKGFTLIELLATIVILGIVVAIAVFSFVNIRESVNERQYQSLASTIKTAAKGYAEDTGINKMFVQTLIDEGLLETDDETKILHDPRNNTSLNCQVVTFDGDKVTITDDENPSCDITVLNDVAIKIQYTNDRGVKEDVKGDVWFNKSITLSVASTGAVPIDLSKATYSWLSPLAPDTTYTRETLTIDNAYVDDTYQVIVSIDDKKYRAYAQVKIDKTEPRSYNLVDKNPTDWSPNKNIEFELSDTGSGIDSWQISFDKYNAPTSWNKIAHPGSKSEKINTTVNLSGLREGESVYVWVKDLVGNTNKTQLSTTSGGESGLKVNTLDGEVDRVALTGNPGSGTYAKKVTLTGTLQDSKSGISSYVCTKSASAPASGWVNVTRTNAEIKVNCPDNLVDANTDYYIYAKDYVGNIKSAKYTVSNFDNKIDLYDVQDITNTGYREQTTLRGTATDNGSGIVAYAFTNSTATPGSWTTVSKRNYLDVTNVVRDNATYYFHVKDNAGNTAYKQVTVSNIVVAKSYPAHLEGVSSVLYGNYYLSGAVQLIRIESNNGSASGNLYGNNVSVTVSGGGSIKKYNPVETCSETAKSSDVIRTETNTCTYTCPNGGYLQGTMCHGYDTGVLVPYTKDNSWVCWYCDEDHEYCNLQEGRYQFYVCDRWDGKDEYCETDYLKGVDQMGKDISHYTWKSQTNCFPDDLDWSNFYHQCTPNGLGWDPKDDCIDQYSWNGDYPADCSSGGKKVEYTCADGQTKVGDKCYSCDAGKTLTAWNTCEYECQTSYDYWNYDITVYYYVIK